MSESKNEQVKNAQQMKKVYQKRNFYTVSDSGLVFVLALLVPLFVGILFSYLMIIIGQSAGVVTLVEETGAYDYSLLYKQVWYFVPYVFVSQISFLAVYLCYHPATRLSYKATSISFKKAKPLTAVISALTGIICVFGFIWLIEGCFTQLFEGIGLDTSSAVNIPAEGMDYNVGWLIFNLFFMGVMPAICEELLFRGVIFKGLREKFSARASILLSALLFALMHQNIIQFIYPFILGCVLGTVMEHTNNLLYTMILHCFNNFTTLILDFLSQNAILDLSFDFMTGSWVAWGWILAIVVALVCGLILFLLWKFYLSKHEKLEETRTGQAAQSSAMVGKIPLTLVIGIVLAVVIIVLNALV